MCTRFFIEDNSEELEAIVHEVERSLLTQRFNSAGERVYTAGEIRPTNVTPVLAPDKSGKQKAFPMRWGFQIPGRSLIVNARLETASEKPTFREAWKSHRCIVPASWYYEWEHYQTSDGKTKTGEKYLIQPRGATVTWLCGLYRIEGELPVFTILTREPSAELRELHDRMPLMLPREAIGEWVRPDTRPETLLPYALTDMAFEKVPAGL